MELTLNHLLEKGIAAHKEGNLQKAEHFYRTVLQTYPNNPDANHNLGVLAVYLNQTAAALPLFLNALQANPNIKQYWMSYIDALIKTNQPKIVNTAIIQAKGYGIVIKKPHKKIVRLTTLLNGEAKVKVFLLQLPAKKKIDDMLANYENGEYEVAKGLALLITQTFPNYQLSWKLLGVIYQQSGKFNKALVVNKKSLKLNPNDAEAHNNLASTLTDLGKIAEAENSYRDAIALKADYVEAHYSLGLLLFEHKQYEKAIEHFMFKDFNKSKFYLLRCFYFLDKKTLFFDQLNDFIKKGVVHPMLGSLGCRSKLRYGIERPNLFCKDPLNYILKTDLAVLYNFDKVFIKTAKTILKQKKIPNRRQSLLTNGYQTSGNLFDLEPELTKEIQKIICLEIDKYKVIFEKSKEGLISGWPATYSLYGWLISMKSGGELQPHMHETGWLSGSIYINVPKKQETESGNLVVCIEEDILSTNNINKRESIGVVTGSMCLFPASLLHYTIPFESLEERIVLAFDVVPN
ncbi:MAG: tetratricopeptide repeat protein [Sphingomonadales bacterium]|tara:strand:+ start:345 stop:1898 length:1554 start_codon:yes stop_codon:yes gene_type:complete